MIPIHHGLCLASVLPTATLRICPGEAHMVLWNHLSEILTTAAGNTCERTEIPFGNVTHKAR